MSEVNSLALALSAFQGEVQNAFAGSRAHNFRYADLASILDIVRPLLAKHKLCVVQLPYSEPDRVGVKTILMHESGQQISSKLSLPLVPQKSMSEAQAVGSVLTYARRYSLGSMLGIAQTDDLDASANAPEQYQGDVVADFKAAPDRKALHVIWKKLTPEQQEQYRDALEARLEELK